MNLYVISQDQNQDYDTYDGAVVCAESESEARTINPNASGVMQDKDWKANYNGWCNGPEHVLVDLIGKARSGMEMGVVLASFNPG